MNNKVVSIGLLGMGTVGCGVFNVFEKNKEELERRIDRPLAITHISAKDVNKKRPIDASKVNFVADPFDIVNDPSVDIVAELIGGNQLSADLVEQAIKNGKHIVTANKALIATKGNKLFDLARKHNVIVAYEAAVAGGIPIIKVLREGLSANRINRIVGIVNGTTNYILSEIKDKQCDFDSALAEAQKLGYAEADPSFDIDGIDAAHKLSIMAAVSFGISLQFEKVYTETSREVMLQDVLYAKEMGYCIKHLATAKRTEKGIELRVHPTLIPADSLLSDVNGAMNAIMVDSNAVGQTLYYGAGAGAEETASAVLADVMDIVRMMDADESTHIPYLGFHNDKIKDIKILDMDDLVSAFYLRLQVKDDSGVLANITKILSRSAISIEAVMQKEKIQDDESVPLILLIHPVQEKLMNSAIDEIEQLDTVADKIIRYRVECL